MNKKIFAFSAIAAVLFLICMWSKAVPTFTLQNLAPTVVIDPGHGGMDGGAMGTSGVCEKELNLQISEKLRDMLTFLGINTHMTRNDDVSLHSEGDSVREKKVSDIKNRVNIINKLNNAWLISIHLNHFSMGKYYGAQVFYGNNKASKGMALRIQETLRCGLDSDNKRVPQPANNVYLLNNVKCPAVLVECGFLSNGNEEKLLQNEDYQRKIALSVAIGFINSYKDVLTNEN